MIFSLLFIFSLKNIFIKTKDEFLFDAFGKRKSYCRLCFLFLISHSYLLVSVRKFLMDRFYKRMRNSECLQPGKNGIVFLVFLLNRFFAVAALLSKLIIE